MNDGERTPEQAAQPLGVVRLVSFAASAAIAALVLLGVVLLRYPMAWTPDLATAPALILGEDVRPQPPERAPAPPPRSIHEPLETPEATDAPSAAAAPSEPPVITAPIWLQRPRNPARFYPREAFMRGVEGQVVLDCVVEINGRLECLIASETPADHGFGAAALAIAAEHVMQPANRDGAPVRARYRMIVPFSTSG